MCTVRRTYVLLGTRRRGDICFCARPVMRDLFLRRLSVCTRRGARVVVTLFLLVSCLLKVLYVANRFSKNSQFGEL